MSKPCIHCTLRDAIDEWLKAGHGDINEVFQCVGQVLADLIADCAPPQAREKYIAAVRRDLRGLVEKRLRANAQHGMAGHA